MGRSFSGTDTSLTVASGLVGERELTQIPANHIKLDFDVIEALAIVNSHKVSNHFGHDDSISEMSLDGGWLFSREHVLFGLLTLQVEPVVFVLNFYMIRELLLAKRLLCLALNSSTTCS